MALPNEHQLNFNSYKNVKSLMKAIEKMFRVRSLPSEWKTHTLIWRNKPDLETLSMDDLHNNLKIHETEIKGSLNSSQNSQVDFVSSNSSGSTNQAHGSNSANTDSISDVVIYSFFANQSNIPQLDNENLQQIDADDLEEMDLKCQMDMLTMRARRFLKKTRRNIDANGSETIRFDKTKVECYSRHKRGHFVRKFRAQRENKNREPVWRNVTIETTDAKALVAQDGFGYDWSDQAEDEPTNFALMAYTSSGSSSSSNSDTKVDDKYKTGKGYHEVPPPYTGNFMPPKPNLILADVDEYVVSDSEDENETETKSKQRKLSFAKIEFVKPNEQMKSPREYVKREEHNRQAKHPRKNSQSPRGNPQLELQEKVDSGCSRHMTGNMSYLSEYEEIDEITDTECVVLSPDFKLLMKAKSCLEFQEKNMYSVDLKNVSPSGGLACLFANATLDESNLCHRRLGHINFKTTNKLVRGNLIRDTLGKFDGKANEGFFVGYSMNSKDSPGDRFKPSEEEEKKDVKDPGNEDYKVPSTVKPRVNQEKDANVNNTNIINTVSPSNNAAGIKDNVVDENIVYGCADDPNMPNLEEIVYSDDDEDVGVEADMTNLDTNILVKEEIDYDEVFALVARIEAIRLFLAYASFKDFVVNQIDVKSAFLYGNIKEEVYVCQPLGFEDPEFPNRVYKVEKALYGLHQAPRAWKEMCTGFKKMMHKKFQMIFMGELTFFLGLQLTQKDKGIFISQDKPDIIFAVCACARFQVTPKVSHLHAMKRIFRYMKGQPKLGLWYPKDSLFDLEAYTDSDYVGASLDRKSTTRGSQFLGRRLISWKCKKQNVVANSTTKADICIVKNLVFHSKTKHIEIRHHVIRDSYERRLIQVIKIHNDHNIVVLLTKAFNVSRFHYLIATAKDGIKVNNDDSSVNAARHYLILLDIT
nr:hypothetical protein [Tanacetum cinerariifolium]